MKHRKVSSFSFSNTPVIRKPRTLFPIPGFDVKTSLNVGELTPIGKPIEVYPGDTFDLNGDFVVRLSSAYIRPVMDTLVIEKAAYFVPCRILYDKFGEVISGGPASPSAWNNTYSQSVPHLPFETEPGVLEKYNITQNTVADYLGCGLGESSAALSCLPFRGFAKIYDDWYRNENVIEPMNIQTGERNLNFETPNNMPWSVNNYFGKLPKVGKKKDYFTSLLPKTQKGSVVDLINLGAQFMPVVGGTDFHPLVNGAKFAPFGDNTAESFEATVQGGFLGRDTMSSGGSVGNHEDFTETNLGINFPGVSMSVTDMRYSVIVQRVQEALARGGNRFTETIAELFGVSSPDARLQRSEFLGGVSVPLAQQAIDQTSQTSGTEYLGTQAAYSLSNGHFHFSKAFTEHGYIFIVACIRQATHNYQQGIPALFNRVSRWDFYVPQMSFISEQPVYATEIFSGADPERVLGYKEAWSELRYFPNVITGNMRTGNSVSYDMMHFGDFYSNTPVLNKEFIEETPVNVDRTIQVQSDKAPNFLGDFLFSGHMVRVLPARSIPGLVDHI